MSTVRTKKKANRGSSPRARSESMAETREALLRAGAELFAARGLDGPSLDDICAAAGKTRGAFYVHFEDRDAFLVAVMERIGLPLLDEIFDGATDLATVASRFLSAAMSGAYPLTREGGVRPHQLIDACMRSPAIRARYVGLVRDAIDRLAAILASDVPAQSREVATFLLAAVIGAQTMLELGVAIDLPRTGASLLPLLGGQRDPSPRSLSPRTDPRRSRPRRS